MVSLCEHKYCEHKYLSPSPPPLSPPPLSPPPLSPPPLPWFFSHLAPFMLVSVFLSSFLDLVSSHSHAKAASSHRYTTEPLSSTQGSSPDHGIAPPTINPQLVDAVSQMDTGELSSLLLNLGLNEGDRAVVFLSKYGDILAIAPSEVHLTFSADESLWINLGIITVTGWTAIKFFADPEFRSTLAWTTAAAVTTHLIVGPDSHTLSGLTLFFILFS